MTELSEVNVDTTDRKNVKKGQDGVKVPGIILFAVTLTFFSVSVDETVLFPFIPQQVRSFNVVSDERLIGYYAGLIGSAYYVGTLISSSPWGMLSDRIGRKPVLVLGIISNIIWSTLYGFSTNLWQAVLTRFCNGLFGGLYPVGKTMVAEIPDSSNVEGIYFTVGLGWALGFLFGPAIGGLFSDAALKYPSVFPANSWVSQFPYALPCVIVATIALFNLLVVSVVLPETLGRAKKESQTMKKAGSSGEVELGEIEVKKPQENDLEIARIEENEEDPGSFNAFFGEWETVLLSVMYAIMGFTVTSFTEVFALWAETDWDYGGLALSSTTVGLIQAAAGPLLIPYQLYLYAPMARFLGPLTTLRLALSAMALLAAYPICKMVSTYTGRALLAAVFMASRGVSVTTGYTTFLILIANSVRHPKYLGAVNGIAQSIQMTLMAAAPATGSTIYAWSISAPHVFPFDYNLFWVLLGSLCLLMLLMSFALPKSLDRRKYVVDEDMKAENLERRFGKSKEIQ